MSYKKAPLAATTAVGVIGVADAAVWGFAVGNVATPVAGTFRTMLPHHQNINPK